MGFGRILVNVERGRVKRGRYGSGLPVELENDGSAEENLFEGIPPRILDQVNVERGRVKPNFNLDFSVGTRLWNEGPKSLTLQLDVINATDRFNVINFTGLFSGTALSPGRMVGVKLRTRF